MSTAHRDHVRYDMGLDLELTLNKKLYIHSKDSHPTRDSAKEDVRLESADDNVKPEGEIGETVADLSSSESEPVADDVATGLRFGSVIPQEVPSVQTSAEDTPAEPPPAPLEPAKELPVVTADEAPRPSLSARTVTARPPSGRDKPAVRDWNAGLTTLIEESESYEDLAADEETTGPYVEPELVIPLRGDIDLRPLAVRGVIPGMPVIEIWHLEEREDSLISELARKKLALTELLTDVEALEEDLRIAEHHDQEVVQAINHVLQDNTQIVQMLSSVNACDPHHREKLLSIAGRYDPHVREATVKALEDAIPISRTKSSMRQSMSYA
ncbi:hypothetical protein BC832DRAFT_592085 [Gaertneriomyces semiglobifer]|nr:hypothetical protein BC832DRAFT_592085 [Gaertneriomyces semiglobifer]